MININYYWKIGKFIFDKNNKCLNITIKCSEFLSYYYGNSNLFELTDMINNQIYFRI